MKKFAGKIVCGDCIELLGAVKKPFADLVFADPPFNIGYKYDKYKDKVKSEKYVAWTRDWMAACVNVLKPGGSFYIAIGAEYAAHVRLIGEQLGMTLRNWIIWHYTFGQQTRAKFARAHTHIFYFVMDKDNFVFNDYAVRIPSDRQLTYNDKRANPEGKLPDDVWNEYSRVCGTFSERLQWHPCQMPESLLMRIISVSSNEGDVVLDPFMGSATTAAAAVQIGRKYCGTELSEEYARNGRKRIADLEKQISKTNRNAATFNARETLELKRLWVDMAIPVKNIIDSRKLIGIFTQQFRLRMNNGKEYDQNDITEAIKEFNIFPGDRRKPVKKIAKPEVKSKDNSRQTELFQI